MSTFAKVSLMAMFIWRNVMTDVGCNTDSLHLIPFYQQGPSIGRLLGWLRAICYLKNRKTD